MSRRLAADWNRAVMLSLVTMTDSRDLADHLVTDGEMERGRLPGTRMIRAICAAVIVPAPLVTPPSGRCRRCMALARK